MVLLPSPFSEIPRAKLLFDSPSSIEHLERLTANLKCGTKFWIKRDDCNSGLAFGGNKVRKLEYLVPDAIEKGATVLVTVGGLQSNHMRQTAAAAARYGLKVALIPSDVVAGQDSEYHHLGNIQLSEILSAERFVNANKDDVLSTLEARGDVPYFIPSGASTHPLGGLGFARWAFELEEQEEGLGIFFDTIVVTVASGSTLGGMIAGFKCIAQTKETEFRSSHGPRRLIGIKAVTVSDEDERATVLKIANTTTERIGVTEMVSADDFEIDGRFTAGAYGKLDEITTKSIKEFASLEGILVDPVYTGKCITGMMAKARAGEFVQSKNVLFVHTGGQSAISAYPSLH